MEFRKVTAIVDSGKLAEVEEQLQRAGVSGITVTRSRGYGERKSPKGMHEDKRVFHMGSLVERMRIEIFIESQRAEEIARLIMETAHTGLPGDGLVVIEPVETVFRIRSRTIATVEDL